MTKYCEPLVSGPRFAMTRSLRSATSLRVIAVAKMHPPFLVHLCPRALKTLILEHPSVDAGSSRTVPLRVVSTLDHEAVDDAMDRTALVGLQSVRTLVADTKGTEAVISLSHAAVAHFSAVFGTLKRQRTATTVAEQLAGEEGELTHR